jgi:hypothetical protein
MATDRPTSDQWCAGCADELEHCHATLVVHADGWLTCSQADVCERQPDLHSWWIACTELTSPCGCTGDEHPGAGRAGDGLLAQAA